MSALSCSGHVAAVVAVSSAKCTLVLVEPLALCKLVWPGTANWSADEPKWPLSTPTTTRRKLHTFEGVSGGRLHAAVRLQLVALLHLVTCLDRGVHKEEVVDRGGSTPREAGPWQACS